jgi:hypothetical protein
MDDDSASFVRITNREIYDGLTDVKSRISSLEITVQAVLQDNIDIKKEYGARLRSIELKNYTMLSGIVTSVLLLLKVGFL